MQRIPTKSVWKEKRKKIYRPPLKAISWKEQNIYSDGHRSTTKSLFVKKEKISIVTIIGLLLKVFFFKKKTNIYSGGFKAATMHLKKRKNKTYTAGQMTDTKSI